MAQSMEDQAGDLAAKSAAPIDAPEGIAVQGAAPSDDAQIPVSMLGGTSPLDSLISSLKSRAEGLVPKLAAARQQQAETGMESAKAEGDAQGKYREELAQIYKNYKPDTIDYGGQPNLPEQNPLKAFGSVASMLGIFASAFTKTPVINALNASASAMNAVRAGDIEGYNGAYKAWKDHTELAMKKNQQDHEFLEDQLDFAGKDNAAALAQIKAYATANDWPAASLLAQAGDLEGLARLSKSLESANGKMANFTSLMLNDQVQAFIEKNKRQPTAAERVDMEKDIKNAGKGGASDAGDYDQKTIDELATQYQLTKTLPPWIRYDKKLGKRIAERATQMDEEKGVSPEERVADQAANKADSSSLNQITKMSDSAIAYEDTALKNMKVAESLMDKGEGTSAGPVVNRWLQGGKTATGDADVRAFNAALETLTNEYAKVMSGSTGAAPATEGARAEAHALVNTADSPEAIKKVMDVMRKDMANRKSSLEEKITGIKKRISSSSSSTAKPATDEDPLGLR